MASTRKRQRESGDDLENGLRTDYKAACNRCKEVDKEKIVMVQCEDGTRTANAELVHALIEEAWISANVLSTS